ncbi:MAG: hypothetical protein PHS37_05460, partial [Candidatus Omnitrophica bacterium]|nr:hypothetical protein [Candidatus Omnitrophota bacterium]
KTTNPGYAKKILKEKAGNNYVRILWGISGGGPLYAEKASPEVERRGTVVTFANGLKLDVAQKTVDITGYPLADKHKIVSVIYRDGTTVKEVPTGEGPGALSVILLSAGNTYSIVVADRKLAVSLIYRLYYLGGAGLEHFKLATQSKSIDGKVSMYLYAITW